ncbi:MAG TPA: hypothetical protein VJQ45_11970, partial [Ktedonobacterales bacterium]|nr:hypothetical protein [Ktedonobacterales bacterium]
MQSRLRETTLNLPRWLGAPGDAADPSTVMFQRIRRSMTLLYAAVLVVTLLLAGSALYFTVDHRLMDPITTSLNRTTQQVANIWGNGLGQAGQTPCDAQGPDQRFSLFACYDALGGLTGASQLAGALPAFTDSSLARRALASASGCASDQITLSSAPP